MSWSLTLPPIWSPILYDDTTYKPYEFQWIKHIGTQLIEEITFTIGGHIIQQYSGSYLQNVVERDFNENKKQLFNIMTGHINELYDPSNYANRNNNYPNAYKHNDASLNSIEPSIHSHNLYIPLNTWFSLMPSMALPLICLQYSELEINFKLKPISHLFTVKDVTYDTTNNINYDEIPRIHANQNVFFLFF